MRVWNIVVENVWKLQQESCGFLQLGGLPWAFCGNAIGFLIPRTQTVSGSYQGVAVAAWGVKLSRVSAALASTFPPLHFSARGGSSGYLRGVGPRGGVCACLCV